MKKEFKVKEKIKKAFHFIKENRQYRALLILGLYFVFFTIVIIIFAPSHYQEPSSPKPEIKESKELLETYGLLSNYRFECQIKYLDEEGPTVYTFNGNLDGKNVQMFTEDNHYLLEDDVIYQIIDEEKEEIEYPLLKEIINFSPNYVYNLIVQATLQTKIEHLQDKSLEKVYYLQVSSLNNITLEEEIRVIITTFEDEEKIKKISINFENLDGETQAINDLESISIKYFD